MADTGKGYIAFFKRESIAFPDAKAHAIFWPLFLGGLSLDLWSKRAVFEWLGDGESFEVIGGFIQLITALNNGAAFGVFAGKSYILTMVSATALLIILAVFLLFSTRQRSMHVALGLFAAGVCGNLYDRLFNHGLVRDFIDVVYWPGRHWPTFNVADSLLCMGVGVLILSTFLTGTPDRKRDQQQR